MPAAAQQQQAEEIGHHLPLVRHRRGHQVIEQRVIGKGGTEQLGSRVKLGRL